MAAKTFIPQALKFLTLGGVLFSLFAPTPLRAGEAVQEKQLQSTLFPKYDGKAHELHIFAGHDEANLSCFFNIKNEPDLVEISLENLADPDGPESLSYKKTELAVYAKSPLADRGVAEINHSGFNFDFKWTETEGTTTESSDVMFYFSDAKNDYTKLNEVTFTETNSDTRNPAAVVRVVHNCRGLNLLADTDEGDEETP